MSRGPASQHAVVKQRVLRSLTRLGDRDTQRVAVQELTDIIATTRPEYVGVLVGCLCDDAAAVSKASARKVRDPLSAGDRSGRRHTESPVACHPPRTSDRVNRKTPSRSRRLQEALRLLGMLTKTQGEHALPHVPRMVAALTRCFKDRDTNVADACVDTMGTLAEFTVSCRPALKLSGYGGNNKPAMAGPEALGGVQTRGECLTLPDPDGFPANRSTSRERGFDETGTRARRHITR